MAKFIHTQNNQRSTCIGGVFSYQELTYKHNLHSWWSSTVACTDGVFECQLAHLLVCTSTYRLVLHNIIYIPNLCTPAANKQWENELIESSHFFHKLLLKAHPLHLLSSTLTAAQLPVEGDTWLSLCVAPSLHMKPVYCVCTKNHYSQWLCNYDYSGCIYISFPANVW